MFEFFGPRPGATWRQTSPTSRSWCQNSTSRGTSSPIALALTSASVRQVVFFMAGSAQEFNQRHVIFKGCSSAKNLGMPPNVLARNKFLERKNFSPVKISKLVFLKFIVIDWFPLSTNIQLKITMKGIPVLQDGSKVGDVKLPPWADNPKDFVSKLRTALGRTDFQDCY